MPELDEQEAETAPDSDLEDLEVSPVQDPKPAKPPDKTERIRSKPHHFPRPPKFACSPKQFFAYWAGLHKEFLDRSMVYVYANWPILDHLKLLTPAERLEVQQKKRKGPDTNIAKPDAPFPADSWREEILHRWGSGTYHFKLNDVGVKSDKEFPNKNICMTTVEIDDPEYPPIRDIRLIDMNHPSNQSYIARERIRGVKFPGDSEIEEANEDMATNTAVEQLTGAVIELSRDRARSNDERLFQQPAATPTTSAAEVVAEGAREGIKILAESIKAARDSEQKAQDPSAYHKSVMDAAAALHQNSAPAAEANAGIMGLVTTLLTQVQTSAATQLEMMSKRLEAAETRTTMLLERLLAPPAAPPPTTAVVPAGAATPNIQGPEGMMGMVTGVLKIFESLEKWRTKANPAPAEPDSPWWAGLAERGIEVVQSVTQTYAQAQYNAAIASGKATGTPVPPSQPAEGPQAPQAGAPATGNDMVTNYLKQIHQPLIQALQVGMPGFAFAAELAQTYGMAPYTWLQSQGKQGLTQLLSSYPPLWGQAIQFPQLDRFLDEFLDDASVRRALVELTNRNSQPAPVPQAPPAQPEPAPRKANVRPIVDGNGKIVQGGGPVINVAVEPEGPKLV